MQELRTNFTLSKASSSVVWSMEERRKVNILEFFDLLSEKVR